MFKEHKLTCAINSTANTASI